MIKRGSDKNDECWAAIMLCPTTLPFFAMVENSSCNKHLRLKEKETFLPSILISYFIYIYIYIKHLWAEEIYFSGQEV